MKKIPLEKQVVKALKYKRSELQEQIAEINAVLNRMAPPVAPPVVHRSDAEQKEVRTLDSMERSRWYSKEQIRKATGMTSMSTSRVVNRLVTDGMLEHKDMGGVPHYRHKVEHMRLVAGEGQVA